MPNWCSNEIVIYGSKEKMKPIVETLRRLENETDTTKEENLVMHALIGPPTEEEVKRDSFYGGRTDRFGTKWDFNLVDDFAPYYEIDEDRVIFDVSTAWSPPDKFLEKLCQKYGVSASITYSEPGCDFAGKAEYDENGVVYEENYDYLEGLYNLSDHFWEEVDFRAECAVDNGDDLETFLGYMPFLDEGDIEEATELYNGYKETSEKEEE